MSSHIPRLVLVVVQPPNNAVAPHRIRHLNIFEAQTRCKIDYCVVLCRDL